jgi:RNA polymerase sigma-70 factor, ECF subfamily
MSPPEDLEKEIETLVRDHGAVLEGFLRGPRLRLPDHLVGDVINDTLMAAWHKLRGGEPLTSPRGFLCTVARNAAIDRLKALYAAGTPSPVPAAGGQDQDSADMLAGVEISEDLRRAVRKLPPQQRRVIELRYLRDFSINETAKILDIAPGTVASTQSAAVWRLRALMEPGNDTREEGI